MKWINIIVIVLFSSPCFGQLHDNMWLFNKVGSNSFQVDFRETPPLISQSEKMPLSFANASFCDTNGNLLYYSNGVLINNQADELMENGDSLNTGYWADTWNYIPAINSAFFLPAPADSSRCYLIYMHPGHFQGADPLIRVYYAIIDMTANNGLGKVLEKNVPLLSGDLELNFNHAGAVKHANGRDWWIIVPHRLKPQYFRILLSPEGFSTPEVQEIGFKVPTVDPNFYGGINLFSQKGDKYVDYEFTTGIQIFDFDRCTGLLSNPYKIDYELGPLDNNAQSGMAFSPSGRFLYLTQVNNLWLELFQYDLSKTDISNSKYLVANCEGPTVNYECTMGRLLLGPDNKIYVTAQIDTVAFHVIHQPDTLGAACDFDFGGFVFPEKFPFGVFPYFPNYRLYDVPGSACDTLGIDAPPGPVSMVSRVEEVEIRVFPNPAHGVCHVTFPVAKDGKAYTVRLMDIFGNTVSTHTFSSGDGDISLDGISPGVYWVQLMKDGNPLGLKKLIKL